LRRGAAAHHDFVRNRREAYSMESAIVLLERSSLIPKQDWRDSSCRRTFLPFEIVRLITNAWKSNQSEVPEQGSIVVSLQADGSAKNAHSVHPMQGQQNDFIGVFEVSFISPDRVKVTLREEECARHAGSPKLAGVSSRSMHRPNTRPVRTNATRRSASGPLLERSLSHSRSAESSEMSSIQLALHPLLAPVRPLPSVAVLCEG